MKLKSLTIAILSVILILCFAGEVFAYNLMGRSWPNAKATIHSTGSSSSHWNDAFVEALNNWNNLSNFTYQNASGYWDPCANPNTYGPPYYNGWDFRPDSCGVSFGTGVLAVATTWFRGSAIIQTGIVFNANQQWDVHHGYGDFYYDFRRVTTHELGHGLGLDHDDSQPALMNSIYSQTIETPQSDDIDGLRAIYGNSSPGDPVPVYRFWSGTFGHHFYTTSEVEKDQLICCDPNWSYEGVAWYVYSSWQPNTSPVYRFWSDTFRGHFFTISEAEKDHLVCCDPNWSYEGVAWYACPDWEPNTISVYRFWSDTLRGHFFTISEAEKDQVICCDPNWSYEGVAYYALSGEGGSGNGTIQWGVISTVCCPGASATFSFTIDGTIKKIGPSCDVTPTWEGYTTASAGTKNFSWIIESSSCATIGDSGSVALSADKCYVFIASLESANIVIRVAETDCGSPLAIRKSLTKENDLKIIDTFIYDYDDSIYDRPNYENDQ